MSLNPFHNMYVRQVRPESDNRAMRNILIIIGEVQRGRPTNRLLRTNIPGNLQVIEDGAYDDFQGQGIKAMKLYMAYTVTRSNPVERLQIAGLLKAGLDPYNGSRRCFQQLLEAEENLRSSQIRHHFNLYTMMRSYLDTPGDLYAYAIFCTRRLRSRYWREYMALVQNDWEELGSFDLGNSLAVPYAAPSVAASAVVAIPASAQVHNLPAPASWYDSDGIPHLPAPARSLYPPVAWTGSGHDLRFPTLSADTFAPTASSGAAQALRLPAASALPVASTSRPAPRQLNLLPGLEETPISTEDFVRRLRSSMQMD